MPVIYVNPVSIKTTKNRWRVTGCCSAATRHTETCYWRWRGGWLWIIQSVFHKAGHSLCLDMLTSAAVVKHLWEKNLRVERVPLIPGTDRGHAGSSLWELQFIRAVTQQLCQKVERKDWWRNGVTIYREHTVWKRNNTTKSVLLKRWQRKPYMNHYRQRRSQIEVT